MDIYFLGRPLNLRGSQYDINGSAFASLFASLLSIDFPEVFEVCSDSLDDEALDVMILVYQDHTSHQSFRPTLSCF